METGLNVWDQLFTKLPIPTTPFSGQTIIVTGASSGLGLETARYLVQLNAEHVILAVRSETKGAEARKAILDSNPDSSTKITVWPLDLANYDSVISFAARADKELPRLDCLIQNAAIAVLKFQKAEEDESTLTVNVISTMLLALLLIPILRRTHESAGKPLAVPPRITFVSSASHVTTTIPLSDIYATLNDEEKADMLMRYGASKLMVLFLAKSLAERIPSSDILINSMDPGAAKTELLRDIDHGIGKIFGAVEQKLLGRPAEHASRGIVWCVEGKKETHGEYCAHCRIYPISRFAKSENGRKAQINLWDETMAKLEKIKPGVTRVLDDQATSQGN